MLPVVLLAAAVALQASVGVLANGAAGAGWSRWEVRRTHDQGHLRRGTAAVEENQALADPDADARNQFLRKCTAVHSVEDPDHLPVGAIEKFCGTTNAVVQCRMDLVARLKEVGGQGGDLSESPNEFCSLAYDWFQKKYGKYCPLQCHKLQCVATCKWLEERKELDEDAQQVQVETVIAAEASDELHKLETSLKGMREEATKGERALEQSKVDVQRATDDYANEKKAAEAAGKRADDAAATVGSVEGARKQLKKDIIADETTLSNLQFELDKLNLKHESQLVRKMKSLDGRVTEATTDLKELGLKAEAQERALAKVKEAQAIETDEVVDQTKAIEQQQKVVDERLAKFQKAKAELEKARADNSPPDALEVVEDLVGQQGAAHKEEVMMLQKMKRNLEKAEEDVVRANTVASREAEAVDAFKKMKGDAQAELDKLKSEKDAADAEAKALKEGDIKAKRQEVDLKAKELAGKNELLQKAEKTLVFQKQLQDEEDAKATAALAKAEQAALRKINAEADADEAKRGLEATATKLRAGVAESVKARQALDKKDEEVLKKQHGNKEAARELDRRQPEIVKQHGLALLTMFDA